MRKIMTKLSFLVILTGVYVFAAIEPVVAPPGPTCSGGGSTCTCARGCSCVSDDHGCSCIC